MDKLNTDTDRADVELECRDLKQENDGLTQEVETLWAEKRAKEAQIAQLELELEQASDRRLVLSADDLMSGGPHGGQPGGGDAAPAQGQVHAAQGGQRQL